MLEGLGDKDYKISILDKETNEVVKEFELDKCLITTSSSFLVLGKFRDIKIDLLTLAAQTMENTLCTMFTYGRACNFSDVLNKNDMKNFDKLKDDLNKHLFMLYDAVATKIDEAAKEVKDEEDTKNYIRVHEGNRVSDKYDYGYCISYLDTYGVMERGNTNPKDPEEYYNNIHQAVCNILTYCSKCIVEKALDEDINVKEELDNGNESLLDAMMEIIDGWVLSVKEFHKNQVLMGQLKNGQKDVVLDELALKNQLEEMLMKKLKDKLEGLTNDEEDIEDDSEDSE